LACLHDGCTRVSQLRDVYNELTSQVPKEDLWAGIIKLLSFITHKFYFFLATVDETHGTLTWLRLLHTDELMY